MVNAFPTPRCFALSVGDHTDLKDIPLGYSCSISAPASCPHHISRGDLRQAKCAGASELEYPAGSRSVGLPVVPGAPLSPGYKR
jgi:hypothetical protein